MPVFFTVTEVKGFPSPPILDTSTGTIGSVYAGVDIEYNVEFQYKIPIVDGESISYIDGTVLKVENKTNLSQYGLTSTNISTTTIAVSGTIVGIFLGEKFNFLMRDKSQKELPYPNTEDWVALVKYTPPNQIVEELISYEVDVSWQTSGPPFSTTGTDATTMTQYVYFSFDSISNTIKQIVSEGEL